MLTNHSIRPVFSGVPQNLTSTLWRCVPLKPHDSDDNDDDQDETDECNDNCSCREASRSRRDKLSSDGPGIINWRWGHYCAKRQAKMTMPLGHIDTIKAKLRQVGKQVNILFYFKWFMERFAVTPWCNDYYKKIPLTRRRSEHTDRNVELKPTDIFRTTPTH